METNLGRFKSLTAPLRAHPHNGRPFGHLYDNTKIVRKHAGLSQLLMIRLSEKEVFLDNKEIDQLQRRIQNALHVGINLVRMLPAGDWTMSFAKEMGLLGNYGNVRIRSCHS